MLLLVLPLASVNSSPWPLKKKHASQISLKLLPYQICKWLLAFFCVIFFFLLTWSISSQTIAWTQPKAGPVRTSSGPLDCPPTLLSHTPSQSLTTIRTPVPRRVGNGVTSGILELQPAKEAAFFCFPLEQIQTPNCSSFCDCVVTIIHSATPLLCSTLGSTFVQGHLFYLFSLSAYRMPRRRFSTGGDEESWSHGLQRVRASLFFLSVLLKHLIEESHLQPINNALPMVWHPNSARFLKMCFFLYLTFTVH